MEQEFSPVLLHKKKKKSLPNKVITKKLPGNKNENMYLDFR